MRRVLSLAMQYKYMQSTRAYNRLYLALRSITPPTPFFWRIDFRAIARSGALGVEGLLSTGWCSGCGDWFLNNNREIFYFMSELVTAHQKCEACTVRPLTEREGLVVFAPADVLIYEAVMTERWCSSSCCAMPKMQKPLRAPAADATPTFDAPDASCRQGLFPFKPPESEVKMQL